MGSGTTFEGVGSSGLLLGSGSFGGAREDNRAFEALHVRMRGAHEVLLRLGMAPRSRTAFISSKLTDDNGLAIMAKLMMWGIGEEELQRVGADTGTLCAGKRRGAQGSTLQTMVRPSTPPL